MSIEYEIHVKTANEMSAGTDANVTISLYGSDGQILDSPLKKTLTNKDAFEKGNLDVFTLMHKNIGTVS